MTMLDRGMYVMGKTILTMEDLKDRGYVGGGDCLEVDREALTAAIAEYEAAGHPALSNDELRVAVGFLAGPSLPAWVEEQFDGELGRGNRKDGEDSGGE